MRRIEYLSLALAFIMQLSAARADNSADARAVVDKAIEAAGGTEKLAKFNTTTFKQKGTYYAQGRSIPFTAKYAVQWPDRFRMEAEGAFTLVLDGDKGWTETQGKAEELSRDVFAEQKANNYFGWVTTLLPLQKDSGFKLGTQPASEVEGRAVEVVKVSRAGHADVILFFDKQTALLVKSEYRGTAKDLGGKEVLFESFYKDYQRNEGAKLPTKLLMKRDGDKRVESEIFDMKAEKKLEEKLFTKPS
ncbi:MAG: hypothetical protein ACJ8C4_18425 [Gemmataceae bacterium]